jgi:hypothetical protein
MEPGQAVVDSMPADDIPWWASLLIVFGLGVLLHAGVHMAIRTIAARRTRCQAEQLRPQVTHGLHPIEGEPAELERAYRLPWYWLAIVWLLALGVSACLGALVGHELLGSAMTGAGMCAAGSLSPWAAPPIRSAVRAVIKRASGRG